MPRQIEVDLALRINNNEQAARVQSRLRWLAYLCGHGPARNESSESALTIEVVELLGEHIKLQQTEAEYLSVITLALKHTISDLSD